MLGLLAAAAGVAAAPAARAEACVTWDGTTSQTLASAIQANSCVSVAAGTFQVPSYIVVPAGHTVTGAGSAATVLRAGPGWNSNGFEGVLNVLTDTPTATISNLTLDADNRATDAVAARGMTLDHTVLENAVCNGVGISGVNVRVIDSTVTRNGFFCPTSPPGSGIYVQADSDPQLSPYLSGNTVVGNGGPGLDVNGAYGGQVIGNMISGNGGWAGVSLYGAQGWVLSGNVVSQPENGVVHPHIAGCRPGRPSGGTGSAAVLLCQVENNRNGLATTGNTIYRNSVVGTYGLLLIGTYPDNVPNSNTLTGNGTHGSRVGCADDNPSRAADANVWWRNDCSGPDTGPRYFAPVPCYPDGGSYGLRTSPGSAVLPRSGSVTLGARLLQSGRPCQAGVNLALYVRGRGAGGFHLSRILTTDGAGLARTTYRQPAGDFRWYVRSFVAPGSVGSPPALVQVR